MTTGRINQVATLRVHFARPSGRLAAETPLGVELRLAAVRPPFRRACRPVGGVLLLLLAQRSRRPSALGVLRTRLWAAEGRALPLSGRRTTRSRAPIAGNGRPAADWRSPSRSRVNRDRLAGLVRLCYKRNRAAHAKLLETRPAKPTTFSAQRARAGEATIAGMPRRQAQGGRHSRWRPRLQMHEGSARGVTAARRLCCQCQGLGGRGEELPRGKIPTRLLPGLSDVWHTSVRHGTRVPDAGPVLRVPYLSQQRPARALTRESSVCHVGRRPSVNSIL